MQNTGLEVLFKGTNFLRLCEGLWVTLRIAVIAMMLSIVLGFFLGMLMKNYATAGVTVFGIFRCGKALEHESVRRESGDYRIYLLGNGRDGRFGAKCIDCHSQASI